MRPLLFRNAKKYKNHNGAGGQSAKRFSRDPSTLREDGLVPAGLRILAPRFARFTCVGAVGTAAHYLALVALVRFVGLEPVLSSGFGFGVGAVVNYRLNYSYTFRSDKRHRDAFAKFLTIALVGLGLNTLLMGLLTQALPVHYLVSQAMTTAVVLLWTFAGNSLWSFR